MATITQIQEPLQFAKMAGGGNDFVVIDNRSGRVTNPEELTRRICIPHMSVGADGLILVERSERASAKMIYYNADGTRADFCANGTRCAVRFALLAGLGSHRMTIETDMGIMNAEVDHGGMVTLSVKSPTDVQLDKPLRIGDRTIQGAFMFIGVPHYVVFLHGGLWQNDIVPLGRSIRQHPDLHPHGANANFVVIRDEHAIEVRTYERGVEAETLSCGSGVVSSVSASALFGKVTSPVKVLTRSGISFEVTFKRDGNELRDMRLRGDARVVYRGSMTSETIEGFDPEFLSKPTEPAMSA